MTVSFDSASWDNAANEFQKTYIMGINDYNRALMHFLKENCMYWDGCRVIDIGSGVGKYAELFAKENCFVTLLDFSPEMLAHARKNLHPYTGRYRLVEADFNTCSTKMFLEEGGFDLAISTMSEAVHDVHTIRKMSRITYGWCFIARFSSWRQPVRDAFLDAMQLRDEESDERESMDVDCANVIRGVWEAGYTPRIRYIDYRWSDVRTPEEFALRILHRCNLTAEQIQGRTEQAVHIAESLADSHGTIKDEVDTETAWIYWET
jgi:SAM-dependent methyltransferase